MTLQLPSDCHEEDEGQAMKVSSLLKRGRFASYGHFDPPSNNDFDFRSLTPHFKEKFWHDGNKV